MQPNLCRVLLRQSQINVLPYRLQSIKLELIRLSYVFEALMRIYVFTDASIIFQIKSISAGAHVCRNFIVRTRVASFHTILFMTFKLYCMMPYSAALKPGYISQIALCIKKEMVQIQQNALLVLPGP